MTEIVTLRDTTTPRLEQKGSGGTDEKQGLGSRLRGNDGKYRNDRGGGNDGGMTASAQTTISSHQIAIAFTL